MQVSCLNILFLFLTKFLFHTINLQIITEGAAYLNQISNQGADYMCVGERGGVGLGWVWGILFKNLDSVSS